MTPQERYDLIEVENLVNSLPEDERELIRWKFSEELTFAEIADRLGVKPSKAYKLVNDIVQELKTHLSVTCVRSRRDTMGVQSTDSLPEGAYT